MTSCGACAIRALAWVRTTDAAQSTLFGYTPRFLLPGAFGWKIVGDATKRQLRSTVFSGVVGKRHARQLNGELQSPIELLTRRGWSSG